MPMLKSSDTGSIQIISTESNEVSENDLAISLDFMGKDNNTWKFNVRVENQSDSTIEFKPRNLYCQFEPAKTGQNSTLISALSLEGELERIRVERDALKKLYDRRNRSQLIDATLDLIDIFVFNPGGQTADEIDADRIEDLEEEQRNLKFNQNYEKKMSDLDSEEEFWRSRILKDTILEVGMTTEGLVYFPIQDYEGSLKIFIQFYPYRYIQKFDQKLVNVQL